MSAPTAVFLVLLALQGQGRPDKRPVGVRPLDFEAARAAARVEQRPILVVFCDGEPDCKRLREGLLGEAQLRKWLAEKVVAIQIDGALSADLARQYRVRRSPTWVFVDERGVELDRLVGVRNALTLRTEGEVVLKGGDPLERLEQRRKGRESDPELRLRRADILADRGDLDAALAEYLAVHAQGGPTATEAFEELAHMARAYPKAADAIDVLAAQLEPPVVVGLASDAEFARWLELCERMRFETRMLAVYDALEHVNEAAGARARALRARIAPRLRDLFYTDRRYVDIGPLLTDPLADLANRRQAHAEAEKRGEASATRRSLALLREDTARDYETLVGLRRLGEAILLADALITFDASVATYDALVEAALRAESRAEAELVAERGRADRRLDAADRARIGSTIPPKTP